MQRNPPFSPRVSTGAPRPESVCRAQSVEAQGAVIGLLLAAGFSRRFGVANKLCQPLADGTWIAVRAARALVQALPQSMAVVRAQDTALQAALAAEGLQLVICDDMHVTQSDSLKQGVAHAQANYPSLQGVVIALADMPFIQPATIVRVAQALSEAATASQPSQPNAAAMHTAPVTMVQPVYQGQPGHPVGFAAAWLPALHTLQGDQGARALLRNHPAQVLRITCEDAGCVVDIDTPEALAALRHSASE